MVSNLSARITRHAGILTQGIFYEGQLHHVGKYYDSFSHGRPYRIVIVGQEYGHEPAKVSLSARSQMVLIDTGLKKDFNQRSPHKRGVTSALRLLFGLPLSIEHNTECLHVCNQQIHLFDAFAQVNYLLCSAVKDGEGRRGKATRLMLGNCAKHFRTTLQILEPSVMIVQSKGYWKWISRTFEQVICIEDKLLYRVRLGMIEILVAVFAHPSTPDNRHNWGRSADTPYLHNTVEPVIARLKSILFGLEPAPDHTPSPQPSPFQGEGDAGFSPLPAGERAAERSSGGRMAR